MALYGSIATLRAQAPKTPGFAAAFKYVEEMLRPGSEIGARVRKLTEGDVEKVDLEGGVFALEQAYETKLRADGFFESHRKCIDIQAMLVGEETMEVGDIARMKVKQPYNADRDLIIYEDSSEVCQLRVYPGQAAIFFPEDVHMPTLRIREPVNVRKVVVKVPVGAA
jgi:YhcH/YjgK/YiaL family protein